MHILQPKHSKLKEDDKEKLLEELNISLSQLPKIKQEDVAIEDLKANVGDIIKIERKDEDDIFVYYRVVV
jgi:DNA-directed RNA polymerase subunit H (RpoH/RPB5)